MNFFKNDELEKEDLIKSNPSRRNTIVEFRKRDNKWRWKYSGPLKVKENF